MVSAGNYRMTEFRKAEERRRIVKGLIGIAVLGISLLTVSLEVYFTQLEAGASETGLVLVPELITAYGAENTQSGETERLIEEKSDEQGGFEYVGRLEIAAYCSEKNARTYSGNIPRAGHTAAGVLSMFEIGDQVMIDGTVYEIEDRVGENSREQLCIYFDNLEDALLFGRQSFDVYKLVSEPIHKDGYLGEFEITGYCSCEQCCGKKEEKLTRMETVPQARYTIAADPLVIPLGTLVEVDGIVYRVEDTGALIQGNRLDIYFDTHQEAVNFGRRKKYVYLHVNSEQSEERERIEE